MVSLYDLSPFKIDMFSSPVETIRPELCQTLDDLIYTHLLLNAVAPSYSVHRYHIILVIQISAYWKLGCTHLYISEVS